MLQKVHKPLLFKRMHRLLGLSLVNSRNATCAPRPLVISWCRTLHRHLPVNSINRQTYYSLFRSSLIQSFNKCLWLTEYFHGGFNHHGNIQVCQRRLDPTNVEHRLTILLEFYMLAVWLVCRKQIPGPLLPNLLVPYQDNGHLTATRRWFNTVHSSNCCAIEMAFGRFKGKFRILKGIDVTRIW